MANATLKMIGGGESARQLNRRRQTDDVRSERASANGANVRYLFEESLGRGI